MNLCFPISKDEGLESRVFGHFGSAPGFIVCNSETLEYKIINSPHEEHQHGQCNPVGRLAGHDIDVLFVGGIGGGALMKLNAAGIRVCHAADATIGENVEYFKQNRLPEFSMNNTCGGHGHNGGGCGH